LFKWRLVEPHRERRNFHRLLASRKLDYSSHHHIHWEGQQQQQPKKE
jgi:hypothetical protein